MKIKKKKRRNEAGNFKCKLNKRKKYSEYVSLVVIDLFAEIKK